MTKFRVSVIRPNRATRARPASPERCMPARAGEIGPIRREIIFEPVHEQPAPAEPAPVEPGPATPDPQPGEPVPAGP